MGVIDQILNEWCDPFVSAARLNEWFTTNFGAADELTADYRTRRRRAADSGGAGRTATGIGREKGVERLLLGRGPYLATPASGCHFDHVIFVRVAGYMVNTFVYF